MLIILRFCGYLVEFINKQDYLTSGEEGGIPEPTAGYRTVVTRAAIHVQQSGGQEVNGGNVLVAIFSQQESYSVYLLEKQDMTRYDAVQFLAHGIKKNQTTFLFISSRLGANTTHRMVTKISDKR